MLSDDEAFRTDIKTRESAAVRRYKIAIAAASAVLVALIIFVSVYFTVNRYSIANWYHNFMEWVFPAGNPLENIMGEDIPGAEATTDAEDSGEEPSDALTTEAAATLEITTEEHSSEQDSSENSTGELVVG
ncbi:MAG: hypothetical protein IJN70_09465 [Clostridia bacterium]|nr:hypothetical protein [Clostridia bacterium]